MAKEQPEEKQEEKKVWDKPPKIYDPDWTEYVLSRLVDDEIFNGKPTVDGLRRITYEIIGYITKTESRVLQVPCPDNGNSATVTVRVHIMTNEKEPRELVFEGSTNVDEASSPDIIGPHTVALSETRAEGRALKRALNLKIITAEEVGENNEIGTVNEIQPTQIDIINKRCKSLKINVDKLVKHECDSGDITKLSFAQAIDLLELMSKYDSNEEEIPDEVKK